MKFLLITGAIQGVFLSFALFFKSGKAGRILSLFIFLLSFELISEFALIDVNSNDDLNYLNIALILIEGSFFMLYGPVFYFYVLFITGFKTRICKRDYLHGIPFFLITVFNVIIYAYIVVIGIENLPRQESSVSQDIQGIISQTVYYLLIFFYITAGMFSV